MKKLFFISTMLACILLSHAAAYAQNDHPHILVKPGDKQAVLQKISQQPWAKKVYEEMMAKVTPYVERHKTDPQWILSRYLMNRAPGKHYTRFYSDEDGTALVRYAGDAPFPTVRVSPHKRQPITADGYSYKVPSIEELVPNDTSMKMWLQSNAPGAKKEWIDPQSFVENINGRINELVLDAAIVYWLSGKEAYARFAADVLSQWARGASYQEPIEGPCRTGFLSIQTLGDARYETLALAYDFLYNYIREQGYDTGWYEGVFEKIARTMTFRGYWNNNWFAAQTPAMIFAALSLENKTRRDFYLDFYLNRDTINGSCGHLALASVVSKWLTPDGHWKEPGGYHNFPISSLLTSALAMENNGYNVFGKYPALFKSSYVLLKYSFPNFSAPSMGDTGPVSQSGECLEMGILMAKKYNDPIAPQLLAAMDVMIRQKGYKRESSDYLGLLCYLPRIPAGTISYSWPRSGELDFAKCYLQRNGTDKETGMMYVVQGASYNHNHANGMAVELYGAGTVMGVDPGKGLTYEAPMHVNYYAQWAAHNTVIAGAASGSVPFFKGGGGMKNIGAISLKAMEPLADKPAVSPSCSFTDTRYTDPSTNTPQQRTLAIIRTGERSGYYLDIYRSANTGSNEYVYHNIGNQLKFLQTNRTALSMQPASFPLSKNPPDPPGLRYINPFSTSGNTDKGAVALFSLDDQKKFMQVLFAPEKGRAFWAGSGPPSGTADLPYRNLPTPTLVCRQEGEARSRPFVAVYEPFSGENNFTVQEIAVAGQQKREEFIAVEVVHKDKSRELVLQSVDSAKEHAGSNWSFTGSFGVVSVQAGEPVYLYVGAGGKLSYQQYAVATNKVDGAANVEIHGSSLRVSCNQETVITIHRTGLQGAVLTGAEGSRSLPVVREKNGLSFTVPAVMNAAIKLN
ncbi:MAG: heparinase II/III family protein [Williamsia sp.]|nr:heparinase II/III family protein [Williamsia sp.]